MQRHYREGDPDQKKPKRPFRSQIDQNRLSSRGNQMPPKMNVGPHADNILTISGFVT
jgi:hypothetical protein